MTIQPIIRTVAVKQPPAQAFTLFADHIKLWWKKGTTLGKTPHDDIVLEKKPGGRWYERGEDGVEMDWGQVLAYEPPGRLLLNMQLNTKFQYDPSLVTEVEIIFVPGADGGTLVTLEHRNLERLGASADGLIAALASGWTSHVAEFGEYAARS